MDATQESGARNHGVARHAQALETVGGQHSDIIRTAACIVNDELVDLLRLGNQQIRIIHRGKRAGVFTGQADTGLQRRHPLRIATINEQRTQQAGDIHDGRKGPDLRANDIAGTVQHRHLHRIRGAAKVNRIGTQTGHDSHRRTRRSAEHPDAVIPLSQINNQFADSGELDRAARSIDTRLCDHETVAELGADNYDGVEPTAGADGYRGIDGIGHMVAAAPRVHAGRPAVRIVNLGTLRRPDKGKGADNKAVVALAAAKIQLGLVVIHHEGVVTIAAVDGEGSADTAAEPAPGAFQQVPEGKSVPSKVRTKDLTDLVSIAFARTIDRRQGAVVIDGKVIGASHRVDGQLLRVGIVVDTLIVRQLLFTRHIDILE